MAVKSSDQPWTDDELEIVRSATIAGMTLRQVQQLLPHRSDNAIANIRQRTGVRSPIQGRPKAVRPVASYAPPDGPTLAEVFAPAASREESREAFRARVLASADRSVEKAAVQNKARIRIPSNLPIGIMVTADWHAATVGTDVRWLFDRAALVRDTPRLFCVGVGDMFDNPIKHRGGAINDVADQLRLLDLLVEEYGGKMLGTTSGNHDDWSKVLAGCDHLLALATRHKIHYAPDELIWDVEIVDPFDADHVTATWTIATRHQYRRQSTLNPLHGCWRWLEEEVATWERIPDVVALAHNHMAAVGVNNYKGKDVWGVRMGSAQVDSAYARAKGFQGFRPTAPVVVLPPTQSGRINCFADAEAAVQFMRGARDAAA
jgi:hypothetical protein